MNSSNKNSVQEIVSALALLGLRKVIICPGSRNAPLTIAFNRHPVFQCTSIRDERSAAFFALGQCIELQQPVAVVCTSGSAALNFAPAIAEAYYQRLPLLVLTADRPAEWVNQGDGQTIHQAQIYRNFIRRSYELFGDTAHADELWHNARSISEGVSVATVLDPGPVHFNIPFREPLYDVGLMEAVGPRVFKSVRPAFHLPQPELKQMANFFARSKKVMILVGQHHPDAHFEAALQKMAAYKNTVILCESTGNVHGNRFIEQIDRVISTLPEPHTARFMPDLLITAGRAVVSKRIKAVLRKYKPAEHWHVDEYDAAMDTYQALTSAIFMEATAFFTELAQAAGETPSAAAGDEGAEHSYSLLWQQRDHQLTQLHERFEETASYSDFYAFSRLYALMPEGLNLYIANSSPIRYAQLFCNRKFAATQSNRGTSGIDGSTSTAVGAAVASPHKEFLFITGDVAFYYDINAFWNELAPENLKIILINNGGGGIFRIIPGPAGTEELEEFFETAQERSAEGVAAAYGWAYQSAASREDLERELAAFFSASGRRILEIFTPAKENAAVLKSYWQYLTRDPQGV